MPGQVLAVSFIEFRSRFSMKTVRHTWRVLGTPLPPPFVIEYHINWPNNSSAMNMIQNFWRCSYGEIIHNSNNEAETHTRKSNNLTSCYSDQR